MLWLAAACKGLDDEHAAAATGAWLQQRGRLIRFIKPGRSVALGVWRAVRRGEQLAGACNVGGAIAVGKESVVTDAMQALGQHVHEEAPDELVRGKRHDLVSG